MTFVLEDASRGRQVRAAAHGLGDRDRGRARSARTCSARTSTSTSRRWSRPPSSTRTAARSRSAPRAPGGYGNGSLELGNALGIKKNLTEGKPNSGDITAYYRIEGGLSGEAGLMLGQQAGGGAGRRRDDGRRSSTPPASPRALQVIATGSYEGQFQLRRALPATSQAALEGLKGLDIKANAGEGQKIQLQLDLDLSDGDVANALLEFVQGVNPITGDPGNTAEAAAELERGAARQRQGADPHLRHQLDQRRRRDRSGRRRSGYRHQHERFRSDRRAATSSRARASSPPRRAFE